MSGTYFDDFDMGNLGENFSSVTGQAQFEWEWRNGYLDVKFLGVVVGGLTLGLDELCRAFGEKEMMRYLRCVREDILETCVQ